MKRETLCEKDPFFNALSSKAAKGHKSETLRIIFFRFSDKIATERKDNNKGGDCTITFLGVFLNSKNSTKTLENERMDSKRLTIFLLLLG